MQYSWAGERVLAPRPVPFFVPRPAWQPVLQEDKCAEAVTGIGPKIFQQDKLVIQVVASKNKKIGILKGRCPLSRFFCYFSWRAKKSKLPAKKVSPFM